MIKSTFRTPFMGLFFWWGGSKSPSFGCVGELRLEPRLHLVGEGEGRERFAKPIGGFAGVLLAVRVAVHLGDVGLKIHHPVVPDPLTGVAPELDSLVLGERGVGDFDQEEDFFSFGVPVAVLIRVGR